MAIRASNFFALPPSLASFAPFFSPEAAPWEWLAGIGPAIASWKSDPPPLFSKPAGLHLEGPAYFHPSVKLPPYGMIVGPVWIGEGVEIRPGALLRGNVIAGAGSVLGTSCEYKNCLLLEGVQTAHFNYVGDSVLGNRSHLGAGAICSNLRLDRNPISVRTPGGVVETGLRKLGAMVGDGAEVGCNAVLNPGALLGPGSVVMPAVSFSGHLPAGSVARHAAGTVVGPLHRIS